MDSKTVSLIIPVYQVRDYLRKCLDSVAAQTYPYLEVVIVNDGSPDDCLDIIQEYTVKYPHFYCHTIENRGQGGARNYGVAHSTGAYIAFLDSDDYLDSHFVEKMVHALESTGSDMTACGNHDVNEEGRVLETYKHTYKNGVTDVFSEPEILFNRVCPWGKLYKRELLEGLEFATRVWYEDMRLMPKIYLRAKKVAYIDDPLVYYVQRQGSTMNNQNVKRNLEVIAAFEDLISYYREQGQYERFRDALEYLVIDHVAVSAIGRVALGKGRERRRVLKKLRRYLATFQDLYRNPYLKQQSRNRKIVLWCNRLRLYGVTKLLLRAKQAVK